jgi:hypothetical protein
MMESVHEQWEANYDAHNLARSSLLDPVGRHVWLVSPPPGICTSIAAAV